MLPRLFIAVGLACLAALTLTNACSSSQRRDQSYGTDAGAGYQPEAAVFTGSDDGGDSDADSEAGEDDATAPLEDDATTPPGDVLLDQAAVQPDAGVEPDATAETDASQESDASIAP